ncbi:MAG: hypothetical protein IJB26_04615 [Clostridia bacterium]|nr:hypothetical protein [Clostridia bacterium]
MGYLFLLLAIIAFLCLEWVLDNILWIGGLIIAYLVFSIIRQIVEVGKYFDGGEFAIVLLKVAGIAGIIFLVCIV